MSDCGQRRDVSVKARLILIIAGSLILAASGLIWAWFLVSMMRPDAVYMLEGGQTVELSRQEFFHQFDQFEVGSTLDTSQLEGLIYTEYEDLGGTHHFSLRSVTAVDGGLWRHPDLHARITTDEHGTITRVHLWDG